MLEQDVGIAALENGAAATHENGVGEPLEHLGFVPELAKRARVLGLVWPQDLRHHEGEQPIVPDEVHLVPAASPEALEDPSPLGDWRPDLEVPAWVLGLPRLWCAHLGARGGFETGNGRGQTREERPGKEFASGRARLARFFGERRWTPLHVDSML